MWKKRLQTAGWCSLGLMALVLLVFGVREKNRKVCSDIQIEIGGGDGHVFVDEKDVLQQLNSSRINVGDEINAIPLRKVEEKISAYAWVKEAQLFVDNNQVVQVRIEERKPWARVFTLQGNSFYIDNEGKQLPLSEKVALRVPVFTSFSNGGPKMSGGDSAVMEDVKKIATYIQNDSFWKAMVSQIDIRSNRTYEIIPVIGNQIIIIGDTSRLKDKFENLYCFYKQVWSKTGFEKYERLDARFAGQIIAVEKGKYRGDATFTSDTLKKGTLDTIKAKPVVPKKVTVTKKNLPKAKKQQPVKNKADIVQAPKDKPKAIMPKLKKKKKNKR